MNRSHSALSTSLRFLCLFLALCCTWSFAGASVAVAATSQPKSVSYHPILHAPHFSALTSPFGAAHGIVKTASENVTTMPVFPAAPPAALPSEVSETLVSATLWNASGQLRSPLAAAQVLEWKRELKTTHPAAPRAAELHLWLGEVAIARDKQPNLGLWHFREAQHLASARDPRHYLAAYDKAIGLFYAGAYQESEDAFRHLLAVRRTAHGFDRQYAALWLRHVSGCVGYHALRSASGIPEPPRLDPLCAAAALAARLQVMGLPSDRKTLLAACRVTGEGSTMQDILNAAPKLGVHARSVTADDQGLIALPKPVVAYVEHDHFIALTHADTHGVSYLCSDCGLWPGGRVNLTWKQWHMMDAGVYVVVTQSGSGWDKTLATLGTPERALASGMPLSRNAAFASSREIENLGAGTPVRLASTHLSGVLPRRVDSLVPALPVLRGHVVLNAMPAGSVRCGQAPIVLYCTPESHHPLDAPAVAQAHASGNPQEGDPVDLATGQEEYGPAPDLVVYNPAGPSISWARTYQTLRGPGQSYPNYTYDGTCQSDDFGAGWSQPYNTGVIVSGSTATVLFPNGGQIGFTFSGRPASGHPLSGTASRSGIPFLLQWDYDGSANGHYEIVFKDRTHWITGSTFAPGSVLPLAQIVDRNGNSLYFNYPITSASKASHGWPLLGSITTGYNGTGTVLLSIQRNTTAGSDGLVDSYITSVTDHPGAPTSRSVFYKNVRLTNPNVPLSYSPYYSELSSVSQIVPGGSAATSAPSRFTYGYKAVPNGEGSEQINCLHTVATPSPTGSGTGIAYFWYMNDNVADASGKTNPNYLSDATVPFIGALVDANGNRRLYFTASGAGQIYGGTDGYSEVKVQNSSGVTVYSYLASYDNNLNETGRTDGNGHPISMTSYADVNSPYSPSTMLDGNATGTALVPVYKAGTTINVSPPGSDSPSNDRAEWNIVNSQGSVIASYDTPAGWSVTVDDPLDLGIPASATPGFYELRVSDDYTTRGNGSGYNYSIGFQIAASGTTASTNLGKTIYTYDQYGNVMTKTSPRGTVTSYSYDYTVFSLGELTQVQEGTNLSTPKSPTFYSYDDTDGYLDAGGHFQPCGLPSSIAMPLPGTTNSTQTATISYTYDVTGRGHQPLGQLGLGNVLTVVRPGNNAASSITTTMGYTSDGSYSQSAAIGQPLTIMDNLGKVTHLRYDSQSNTTGIKDAIGNETDAAYTIGNQPLQTVLPSTVQTGSGHSGSLVSYLYAEPTSLATASWPAATLQYGPATTTTQYDEGNVGAIRQVVKVYGLEGELASVSGSTEPVAYTYDAQYRTKTLKDAALNTTSYFYNAAGYLAQVVYPGAQSTPPTAPLAAGTKDTMSFTSYDGKGDVLTRVDGNNVATNYTYNDLESRLTDITYPAGTIGAVHLAYDAYGRRSTMTDGTGSQTYAYDDDDNLTTKNVTWTGFSAKAITYTFNPNGSRHTMTADGNAFTYSYDAVGRMSQMLNPFGETTQWSYQANGWLQERLLSAPLGGGSTYVLDTVSTLNALGQVTDLANYDNEGDTLSEYGSLTGTGKMTYDGVGNRLSVAASVPGAPASYSGTTSYQYDYGQTQSPQMSRSQVTGETSTRGSGSFGYGYDGGTSGGPGNPTSFKGATNTFNADNQVTNTGYGYDGNGNPTTYGTGLMTFDPENRLLTAPGLGLNMSYTYDGDGHQVTRKALARGAPRLFYYKLYDGDTLINQYNATGSTLTLFYTDTVGADGLVSVHALPAGTSTFYAYDERGNVSQRLNSAGAIQSSDMYDVYGKCTSTATSQADYVGFGGQWGYYNDYYLGYILCTHRFYDPSTGRFITRDPIGYDGGINLYGYVGNNPGTHWDPSGYDMTSGAIFSGGLRIAGAAEILGGGPEDPVADVVAGAVLVGAGAWATGVILYDQLGNLPMENGPPNGSLSEDAGIAGGSKGKIRDYGPDGRAKCDYDINHPAKDGPNPHAHDWDWPEDGGPPQRMHPGRALNPGE